MFIGHIRQTLKTERCHHDGNFVITGGTRGCHYDNLWCLQWWQSWHHENSGFSVDAIPYLAHYCMFTWHTGEMEQKFFFFFLEITNNTIRSSGWQPWWSLEMLKLAFVSNEHQGCQHDNISVSVYDKISISQMIILWFHFNISNHNLHYIQYNDAQKSI